MKMFKRRFDLHIINLSKHNLVSSSSNRVRPNHELFYSNNTAGITRNRIILNFKCSFLHFSQMRTLEKGEFNLIFFFVKSLFICIAFRNKFINTSEI